MERRDFLSTSLAASAGLAAFGLNSAQADHHKNDKHKFKLKYAPHFNMFRHHAGKDLVDQMKFMADQGFTAIEDNQLLKRSPEDQKRVAKALEDLNMTMGVFVAHGNLKETTLASGKQGPIDLAIEDMKKSVELAKMVNAKWVTVVPGIFDHKLPEEYQTANVAEGLKRCAEICEPSGLVMVLEPLNHFVNHPEAFLHGSPQTYLVCKTVNSPSCKILFDIYHQQITEGNLINNIKQCWDEIGYFQIGDNPGRKEPGTGEINYQNIFQYIHSTDYKGVMGMEHGNSIKGKEGEQAVIDAYIKADSFEVAK